MATKNRGVCAARGKCCAGPLDSRGRFFAAAAEAMRRVLIESDRRKGRQKRGGAWLCFDIAINEPAIDEPTFDVLAIDDALMQLAHEHPEQIVKLRYFAGHRPKRLRHWTFHCNC